MSTKRSKNAFPMPKMARPHVVWVSLISAMTAVGGALLLLDGRTATGSSAVALASLNRPADADANFEALFATAAPLEQGRWSGIVIHHSASPVGSAASIADQHTARGLKGLGYHFVISNGQGAPDGQIVVGSRWQAQLPGAHVSGPRAEQYNRQTIGICLVGDGERREFTEAQVARLVELVTALQKKLGIPDRSVVLHRDVGPTSSPGRLFPELAFRQILSDTP
ncbi:MAG: peptidoglycan recognition family protein [Planctomycetota bacterium]|nr:peptidoglycan recognition family protein [Planctomycetota bacterium]